MSEPVPAGLDERAVGGARIGEPAVRAGLDERLLGGVRIGEPETRPGLDGRAVESARISEPARPRLAFLGLPRTGKSTFLGAFWALVQSPVETSVRETRFGGDRSYVQRLAEQVARGEELDRTALDADEGLSVALRFGELGVAELVVPDLSGEALRVLVERRIWYPRLLDACSEATAILVFVHPDRLRLPVRIAAGGGFAAAGGGGVADAGGGDVAAAGGGGAVAGGGGAVAGGGVAGAGEAVSFHPDDPIGFRADDHVCTAAELIDAFENLAGLWNGRRPVRVGIIVSAWDRVGGDPKPSPYQWLQARLPGILATLESNRDVADFEVFGVSAQGGPLEAREELLARGEVCDRVFAEDRSGRRISLVDPVRWAIWGS
jgi:hypothetical protein